MDITLTNSHTNLHIHGIIVAHRYIATTNDFTDVQLGGVRLERYKESTRHEYTLWRHPSPSDDVVCPPPARASIAGQAVYIGTPDKKNPRIVGWCHHDQCVYSIVIGMFGDPRLDGQAVYDESTHALIGMVKRTQFDEYVDVVPYDILHAAATSPHLPYSILTPISLPMFQWINDDTSIDENGVYHKCYFRMVDINAEQGMDSKVSDALTVSGSFVPCTMQPVSTSTLAAFRGYMFVSSNDKVHCKIRPKTPAPNSMAVPPHAWVVKIHDHTVTSMNGMLKYLQENYQRIPPEFIIKWSNGVHEKTPVGTLTKSPQVFA